MQWILTLTQVWEEKFLKKVISRDGTEIAYEIIGSGEPLIVAGGALSDHSAAAELSKVLSKYFSVISYDRRGRGESGDSFIYEPLREIEDIEALARLFEEEVFLYGHSSGAALVLRACTYYGDLVKGAILYEPPFNSDAKATEFFVKSKEDLKKLILNKDADAAVSHFLSFIGLPEVKIAESKNSLEWEKMLKIYHTLEYEMEILGKNGEIPVSLARKINIPTLILYGEKSLDSLAATAIKLSELIPDSVLKSFQGQYHNPHPEILGKEIIDFKDSLTV